MPCGWTFLALVFLDQLLARWPAPACYGWSTSARWLLVWLLPLVGMLAWFLFASPKARLRVARRTPRREGARLRPGLARSRRRATISLAVALGRVLGGDQRRSR